MRARFHTTLFTIIPAFLVATAFLATPARAAIAIDASTRKRSRARLNRHQSHLKPAASIRNYNHGESVVEKAKL